ncbi:uncharacterized protein N7515_002857 [Penicillium bovifimosum]|uniref:Zn(2)-C6 fungal-type domain-containing protein n=1 Tax=Penicillium bovifimosum TaxID=126998 RepID=A0A9W9HD06_9EURO|nr:uncharacterized protein N7515_002857 [Penicillium bovifimosum]KAJ5144070.1 hypothetical protein N7515_002857 [Penicillium bovifimosum]
MQTEFHIEQCRRIRRVKCGEERPSCLRCSSTGRKCDFEERPSPSTVSIISPSALSSNTNTVWRERRAFAYYFEFAASSVGGGLDLDFWRTIVPQVCRDEPAVWDAIIAISALFETSKQGLDAFSQRKKGPDSLSQSHQDALGWYSRSVSAVRQRIERGSVDIFVGLISCVLFICIEAVQGNAEGALQLYRQGVQLILTMRPQIASGAIPANKAALLEETIIPIFVRLAAIAPAIAGTPVTALLRDTEISSAQTFDSLRAARQGIVYLAVEIPLFERDCMKHLIQPHVTRVPEEFITQAFSLGARLRNWHIAFENLMHRLRGKGVLSMQQIGTSALLSSYHDMLFVMLQTCTSLSLMQFDAYLPNFQNIVEQSTIALEASIRSDGTQPPFTFELSVGLPLWFTSVRCREPRTRRAALALLHRSPHIQGFYECSFGAAVSQKIMELEESQAMAMNATYQANIGTIEPASDPAAASELTIGLQSAPSELVSRVPTTLVIPEEVRIGPIDVFRPSDGLLPGTTERDVAKWNRSIDQPFCGFRGLSAVLLAILCGLLMNVFRLIFDHGLMCRLASRYP